MKQAKQKIIIVLFILAFALFGLWKAGLIPFQIGFTTLSLSQIDYVSNDPDVGGKAWTMNVVLNQQGQYAVAVSDPTVLRDNLENVKSKASLTVKVESFPQTCQYNIDNRHLSEKVYEINVEKIKCNWICNCDNAINTCKEKPDYYNYAKHSGDCDIKCWRKTELGTHGLLRTPSTIWKAKITTTTNEGKEESKEVTNWGSQSGWLGSNVYYSWVGNLVSGEECPKTSLPETMFYGGSWITTKPGKYQTYVSNADSAFINCVNNWLNNWGETWENCDNYYNNYALSTLEAEPLVMYNLEGGAIASTSTGNSNINNGQINLTVDKMLQFPQLILKIKADWVGIVQEVGKPKITSLTSTDFTTGSQGTLTAIIQNIGSGSGSFNTYATCSAGFSQSGKSPDYLNLAPNEIGTQYIYISGTCSADSTGGCTVTVEDRNNPNNKDMSSTSIKCKTICECTQAGEKDCRGDDIVRCDGCRWQREETCKQGCIIEGGVVKCQSPKTCQVDSDCDDQNPFTIDKCEHPLIGENYCTNKASCGLEYERCGGLFDKKCCPGLTCDKSGICIQKKEVDWTKILMILGGGGGVALVIYMILRRERK